MSDWNGFAGPNAGYVEELYERFLEDPSSVDEATRAYFDRHRFRRPVDGSAVRESFGGMGLGASESDLDRLTSAVHLSRSIRMLGHLAADIDPLGRPRTGDPALEPESYGLSLADLEAMPASTMLLAPEIAAGMSNAREAFEYLRQRYCGTTGFDWRQIRDPQERDWLQEAIESNAFRHPTMPVQRTRLLQRLVEVECFEQFLHRIFPGKTRFSIEGLDMLVPILDDVIRSAADSGTRNTLLGMAHRGRMNVLAHVLQKPYCDIFTEFKDPMLSRYFHEDESRTGDVKYHLGARRKIEGGEEVDLHVSLAPNPSHLEFIHPVVEGMARAAGTRCDLAGKPVFDPDLTLPIVIHGDAAFVGQGVVAETLNFSRLANYTTGGTIHLIANNQLGYTALPSESCGTMYASDLAKGFKIPIVHVNADDVEACIEAARLAFAYRTKFHKDFLIDLVGYRRYGHNEGDEPTFTQPLMYAIIKDHPSVMHRYAEQLGKTGDGDDDLPALVRAQMERLEKELESVDTDRCVLTPPETPEDVKIATVETGVEQERLVALHRALLEVPDSFHLNSKIVRSLKRRAKTFDDYDSASVDWAQAESLALGSILEDGIPIRFTGEDVERGTFSQRHAVYHDVENGDEFTPLASLESARAAFEIANSPLTENAAIGFEFGYNVEAPERLVIWEAQYGDFINGAQVMLDEFVLSARAKWNQTPSLVLLLPHGYEGQGPDHCTARVERFLELAAENNARIANCTTAAQYFHLLRGQAHLVQRDPKPLIVLTPKSLLRHPKVASTPRDFVEGTFLPLIGDERADTHPKDVKRLVFCSGKIYVDLDSSDMRAKTKSVAICRIEQLFPLPCNEIEASIAKYPNLEEVVWVQEEPSNMGAWDFMRPRLKEILDGTNKPLHYLGRPRRSSPAEGSAAWHASNQAAIVETAFDRRRRLCEVDTAQSRGKKMK